MEWADLAAKLVEYIDSTKDFVLEQAPAFFREIVFYGRAYYTSCLALSLVIFAAGTTCAWRCGKRVKEDRQYASLEEGSTKYLIATLALGALSFVGFLGVFGCFSRFFMSWCAPKLFIIKYLLG